MEFTLDVYCGIYFLMQRVLYYRQCLWCSNLHRVISYAVFRDLLFSYRDEKVKLGFVLRDL